MCRPHRRIAQTIGTIAIRLMYMAKEGSQPFQYRKR